MAYLLKIAFLRTRLGRWTWAWVRRKRGAALGSRERFRTCLRDGAPDRRLAFVGGFAAGEREDVATAVQAGASEVVAVVLDEGRSELEAAAAEMGLRLVVGDPARRPTRRRLGTIDVVVCSDVLPHHPSPFELLVSLRELCTETLILRTPTIPEMRGLPQTGVYLPWLPARDRKRWMFLGPDERAGLPLSEHFHDSAEHANWFWALSPSCAKALLASAGFDVIRQLSEPFEQTFVCTPRKTTMLTRSLVPASTPDPVGPSVEERLHWVDDLREDWLAAIRPFDDSVESIFHRARELTPDRLARCRVVPSREYLVAQCLPKGGVVAELGTQHGTFAKTILADARPETLHLVDQSFDEFDHPAFAKAIAKGAVVLHENDSAAAIAAFPDEHFDWIYIDANHTHAGVLHDIHAAKTKVKRGGLLVFNDYVLWSHAELMEYGVVQAVNQFCEQEDWDFAYLALNPQMYCDVAIMRRSDAHNGGNGDPNR